MKKNTKETKVCFLADFECSLKDVNLLDLCLDLRLLCEDSLPTVVAVLVNVTSSALMG